jgi:DNA-directed RNA polymerase specialized sigma24 family protein
MRKPILRKEIRLQDLPDLVQEEYNPARDEQLQKMYDCISLLDEVGTMIILLILEGVEYSEIAAVVGINEETLRVRIHRIKLKLTNCVKL